MFEFVRKNTQPNTSTLHRPILFGVVEVLREVYAHDRYADKAIEYAFKKNRKWGSRDRQFFAKATYDIVRWWRRLCYSVNLDPLVAANFDNADLCKVLGAWLLINDYELPRWPEFSTIRVSDVMQKWSYAENHRALGQSYPDWLYQLGEDELGARWTRIASALNEPAPVYLRANTLKCNRDQLLAELRGEEIPAEIAPKVIDGVYLKERKNVFQTKAFKNGLFEVQDGGSQLIAPFLQVEPGHRVIDACAGAGGKSLHLAALMKDSGKIIALDIHDHKLAELKKRARRAGVSNIETRQVASLKIIKRMAESADRVLLDVPCSGSGVIRRNPDTKWKLSVVELDRLRFTQRELLFSYSRMVRKGGKLVYATCSVFPSENEKQIERFLAESGSSWKLEKELLIWPDESSFDGFYAARLIRT